MPGRPRARPALRARPVGLARSVALAGLAVSLFAGDAAAQTPAESEVRQIVTFSFLPGGYTEALAIYHEEALPLYREDEAMLSLRVFREVESPVPLGLTVIRGFRGMSGMDASNDRLRELASAAGTSIGAIYGRISERTSGHTDEFVEMLPALGAGDPSSTRLTAMVRYRVLPGSREAFEQALATLVAVSADVADVPSATGRFLVSDGWDYLRILGFDSLGDYQAYWSTLAVRPEFRRLSELVAVHRETIVANLPDLAVR